MIRFPSRLRVFLFNIRIGVRALRAPTSQTGACLKPRSTDGNHHFDIMKLVEHHHDVRTTLTLDDDVAAKLRTEIRRSGRTFKEVVNEALRTGLTPRRRAAKEKRFVVRARPLGLRPGLSYDATGELVEMLEGAQHR